MGRFNEGDEVVVARAIEQYDITAVGSEGKVINFHTSPPDGEVWVDFYRITGITSLVNNTIWPIKEECLELVKQQPALRVPNKKPVINKYEHKRLIRL